MVSVFLVSFPVVRRALGSLVLCALVCGCGGKEEIRQYRVAKDQPAGDLNPVGSADNPSTSAPRNADATLESSAGGAPTARMLAALVETSDRVWSFKLLGSLEDVGNSAEAFKGWMKSLTFVEDPQTPGSTIPQWTLPPGWEQQPASQMRFATVLPDPAKPELQISVIGLPRPQDQLANVNRWRGQLQLNPLTREQLQQTTESLELAGGNGVLVDLAGQADPQGIMGPAGMAAPFAGGGSGIAPPPTPPAIAAAPAATDTTDETGLEVHPPAGWEPQPLKMSQSHSWKVPGGEQSAECTVSQLGAAGGDPLMNVNRWRGQIQLPPLDAAGLEAELKTLVVGGHDAKFVRIDNPAIPPNGESILGALLPYQDSVWFFKLRGPTPLVEATRGDFEKFCAEVKFP